MGDEAWASRRSSPSPRPHSPKYAHPPTCPLQTEALEAEELKAHLAVEAALNAEEEAWMEEAESETEKETEDNRKRYEIEVEIEVRELERQAQYKAKRLLEAHYEADLGAAGGGALGRSAPMEPKGDTPGRRSPGGSGGAYKADLNTFVDVSAPANAYAVIEPDAWANAQKDMEQRTLRRQQRALQSQARSQSPQPQSPRTRTPRAREPRAPSGRYSPASRASPTPAQSMIQQLLARASPTPSASARSSTPHGRRRRGVAVSLDNAASFERDREVRCERPPSTVTTCDPDSTSMIPYWYRRIGRFANTTRVLDTPVSPTT